jgi:serine/threonine-protein kinase
MPDLQPGDLLDNKYELKELLAKSGMASIFEAVDRETGAKVALKIPYVHFESDVVFYERFRREQEVGQRLDHPGVVKVLPRPKTNRMYIAMELVDGTSLRALMRESRLPLERALDIARQLAAVLVYLHSKGVVHRDLKPENVLITPEGRVKLLDFGIALDEAARRLTWFGLSSTLGTPDFMAPEQVNGRRGDVRTDVYALGTILYEMLTGSLPFPRGTPQAILKAKAAEDPPSPRSHEPSLDPKIEEIVLRAIERDPRDRYQRASELLADLEDPSRVVPQDRSLRRVKKTRVLGIPRALLFPIAVCVVIVTLLCLIWMTHRHSVHEVSQQEPVPS